MGLTGPDLANAIGDDPTIGASRYSFADLFGGGGDDNDDDGNSLGGFDGDRESSPGGWGGY